MHIDLVFDNELDPGLYQRYSQFIYRRVLDDVQRLANRKRRNYQVRVPYIMNLVPWINKPKEINLVDYVTHSLRLRKVHDTYVIDLDSSHRVKGSNMKVSQLVRLLEYGTIELKELPVIRRVFNKYSQSYKGLFDDYLKEVLR